MQSEWHKVYCLKPFSFHTVNWLKYSPIPCNFEKKMWFENVFSLRALAYFCYFGLQVEKRRQETQENCIISMNFYEFKNKHLSWVKAEQSYWTLKTLLEIWIWRFQSTLMFQTFFDFLFELFLLTFGLLKTQLCFAKLCHHLNLQLDAVRTMKFWERVIFDKYSIELFKVIVKNWMHF